MRDYDKKRCVKCRRFFKKEDLTIDIHGRLCKDCRPMVVEAHSNDWTNHREHLNSLTG